MNSSVGVENFVEVFDHQIRKRIIIGPWFIGVILNWFLFGALVIQFYDYLLHYRASDRKLVRGMTHLLLVTECVQTLLITRAAWEVIIEGWFSSKNPWSQIPVTAAYIPATNAFVSCVTQLFFAWRIFVLTWSTTWRIISGTIAVLAVTQLSAGIATSVRYFQIDLSPDRWSEIHDVIGVWMAGTVMADMMIAVSMFYMLRKARRESALPLAQGWVNSVIVHTFETGAITASIAAVEVFCFFQFQNNYVHIVPLVVLGRIYSNVVVSTLNGRSRVLKDGHGNSSSGGKPIFCIGPMITTTTTTTATTAITAQKNSRLNSRAGVPKFAFPSPSPSPGHGHGHGASDSIDTTTAAASTSTANKSQLSSFSEHSTDSSRPTSPFVSSFATAATTTTSIPEPRKEIWDTEEGGGNNSLTRSLPCVLSLRGGGGGGGFHAGFAKKQEDDDDEKVGEEELS